MRRLCGCFILPLLLSSLVAQTTPNVPQNVVVIRHVTVIDATGAPARPDMTVTIAGDHITSIAKGSQAVIPQDAQVVEAAGKFLIPGLWDMHVHPIGKDYLPLFIANGVTGIRIMWGFPDYYEWRKQIEAGQLLGPGMWIASPIIDGPARYWPGSVSVSTEQQARQAVDMAKQYGADFVKVYQGLPREEYFAIADEAKKQGISFVGHVPLSVSAQEASHAGQKSFEHLVGILPACSTRDAELLQAQQADLAEDIASDKPKFWGPGVKETREMMLDTYSPEKVAALSAVLKSNGTWQVPTFTLLHMFAYGDDPALLKDVRLKYLPIRITGRWDPAAVDGKHTREDFAYGKKEFQKDLEVVGAMQKAGVGILAGTDTANPYCFPGFGLHDELGYLVQAGLTPMQALQAATLNPARFLGREQDVGTVEVGKIADLVLLDANPLDNIGNTRKIDTVIHGGRVYDRSTLDGMLAKVQDLASRKPIGETMFKTVQEKGADAAVAQYRELKTTQPAAYDFSENELIDLGYRLIHMKKFVDAIAIFKLSVEAYPRSYNTYDSLAEAYMDDGDKQLAIENYQKSLQINPGNTNGVKMLKKLNAQ
jgi:imidazolonepropionase-like amidohydrolase